MPSTKSKIKKTKSTTRVIDHGFYKQDPHSSNCGCSVVVTQHVDGDFINNELRIAANSISQSGTITISDLNGDDLRQLANYLKKAADILDPVALEEHGP
jgi:hypothetical protein